MFLFAGGGFTDNRFGIFTGPDHGFGSAYAGIKAGLPWGADNQAFTQGFNPEKFFPWLEKMKPYQATCLFVAVPDVVGDAIQTLANWRHWVRYFNGWPLGFVAQDGQENLTMPIDFHTLFIGGGTEWKEGQGAINCIKRGQEMGKHIHIGRVNSWRRYRHFRRMPGSDTWTCDGNSQIWGRKQAINKWLRYMSQPPLLRI